MGLSFTKDVLSSITATDYLDMVRGHNYGARTLVSALTTYLGTDLTSLTGLTTLTMPSGTFTMTTGNAVLTSGNLTLTNGNIVHTAGNNTMSDGVFSQAKTITGTALSTVRGVMGQITTSGTAIQSGSVCAVRGINTLSGTVTNCPAEVYWYGTQGKMVISGTMGDEGARCYALVGQVDVSGGTITNGLLSALDLEFVGLSGTGTADNQTNFIRMTAPNGGTPSCALWIQSDLSYLMMLDHPTGDTVSYYLTAGTGANSAGQAGGGVAAKVLKVFIDGADAYIPVFSSNAN